MGDRRGTVVRGAHARPPSPLRVVSPPVEFVAEALDERAGAAAWYKTGTPAVAASSPQEKTRENAREGPCPCAVVSFARGGPLGGLPHALRVAHAPGGAQPWVLMWAADRRRRLVNSARTNPIIGQEAVPVATPQQRNNGR